MNETLKPTRRARQTPESIQTLVKLASSLVKEGVRAIDFFEDGSIARMDFFETPHIAHCAPAQEAPAQPSLEAMAEQIRGDRPSPDKEVRSMEELNELLAAQHRLAYHSS